MQKISCTPNQAPTVRVALLAQTPSGVVEAFDFSEYQPELFEKFQALRNDGPYVLTADTFRSYQNKFKTAPTGSTKVNVDFIFIFGKENLFAASKDYSTEPPPPQVIAVWCRVCPAGIGKVKQIVASMQATLMHMVCDFEESTPAGLDQPN